MIDKTINYNRFGVETSNTAKEYLNKNVNKVLDYKLNIGETIKGHLVQNAGVTLLKTTEGHLIPAKLLENVDLGKLLQFMVIGEKDGKFLLELQNLDKSELMDTIDKIISELKLPNNDNIKKIIYKLLDQNLPLDKNTINKMYSAQKLYDLPIETLVNLNKQGSEIDLNEINNLSDLKKSSLAQITKNFSDMIDSNSDINSLKVLIKNIASNLDITKLEKSIYATLQNEHINDSNDENIPKNYIKNSILNNIKDIVSKGTLLESMPNTDKLGINLPEQNVSKIDMDLILNHLYKELESSNSKDSLVKSLAKNLIKSYMSLDMETLKTNIEETKNTTNLHDKLETILKEFEKLEHTKDQDINSSISLNKSAAEMNDILSSIKKYNIDGQYFCFPMTINDEQRTGELYFFKPKKTIKNTDEKLYIVLALDMPNLNKIEVHIRQLQDNIEILLKVKSEDIQTYLSDKKDELLTLMNNTGFNISNIDVRLLDADKEEKYDEISLYHLDIKA